MNAFNMHKSLINEYLTYYGGSEKDFKRDTSNDRTDLDIIREYHRFLWDDVEADSWEKKLAKRYYDKLFKEYSICDLSRYKENKVALRWRTKQEVMVGKGQFLCGTKACNTKEDLRSWEMNFAYMEDNEKKNALVKLRLCPDCSTKLNYRSKKREIKRAKSTHKKESVSQKAICEAKSKSDNDFGNVNNDKENFEESYDDVAGSSTENPWNKSQEIKEKCREDEIEDYLEILLL